MLELLESGITVERVVKDEQGPPLADQPEGGRQQDTPDPPV